MSQHDGFPAFDGWHCWLVQQWNPGTNFALLGKPAVAPNLSIRL